MELSHWLGLMTPATALGAAVFIWRAGDRARPDLAEAEKRIIANAEKAHAAIGEKIRRLDCTVDNGLAALGNRMDGLDWKVDAIKNNLADTREDVAALKAYLLPPHLRRRQR